MRPITALVMVEAAGDEQLPASWIRAARRKATIDLLLQLERIPTITDIILATPQAAGIIEHCHRTAHYPTSPDAIHIGEFLSDLARKTPEGGLLYFGGGSAPLLTDESIATIVNRLANSDQLIIVNNRFSSDWAGIMPASAIVPLAEKLPRDNMLGWSLSHDGGLPCVTMARTSEMILDIDTPTDLRALKIHPDTKAHLKHYLERLPISAAQFNMAIEIMTTPGARLFVAGRIAPAIWRRLNQLTQCWIRVLAEERGMVSSGREAQGEVFSLLETLLSQSGIDPFFAGIHRWADLAIIDTRVLMAHRGEKLPANDRFASDLGMIDRIQSTWLRQLTLAAQCAQIPILFGGHSLLNGNLLTLCDLIEERGAQPSG